MSKVIIVGDMAVGKTSLVQRFVTNSFNHDYKATIGVDFEIEKFLILNANFNLQIWDTAGQVTITIHLEKKNLFLIFF